jgi:hypothetical protein
MQYQLPSNDSRPELDPSSPVERMLKTRFGESVIGLELLRRAAPVESPGSQPVQELGQHDAEVVNLTEYRHKSEEEARLEQIRAQVNQEAA